MRDGMLATEAGTRSANSFNVFNFGTAGRRVRRSSPDLARIWRCLFWLPFKWCESLSLLHCIGRVDAPTGGKVGGRNLSRTK